MKTNPAKSQFLSGNLGEGALVRQEATKKDIHSFKFTLNSALLAK